MIEISFTEFLIGKRERMSWIQETSYGTGGTMSSGEIVGYDCIIEPDFSQGWQEYLTGGADNRNVQGRVKGPLQLPYTMTFTPVNWRWLKYIMAVADAGGPVYTHTFTMRNTILSYKMEWARRASTNHVLTVVGNAVKSANISWSKATGEGTDGWLKVALQCVGQDVSEGSSVTSLSNLSNDPFQYRSCKITIDGSEYKEVNNGEMNINNGVEEQDSRYCNSTYDNLLGEPIPKTFRITGRFNITIKDSTLYDLWAAGTAVSGACTLLFDRDGSGDDQILFTYNNFFIFKAIGPTNLEGPTNVDVIWAANAFTSVVAKDGVATY